MKTTLRIVGFLTVAGGVLMILNGTRDGMYVAGGALLLLIWAMQD